MLLLLFAGDLVALGLSHLTSHQQSQMCRPTDHTKLMARMWKQKEQHLNL